jgi:undecaprenyl-diphosphatase
MESLITWDQHLFEFINNVWTNPLLDTVFPDWRDKKTWYPLYLFIIIFSIYKFKLKGLFFVLAVILSIGLADLCSSQLLKKNVKRLRPCNDIEMKDDVRLLVHCGKAYSFTSSHAANHFAIATFISLTLGLIYRKIRWPLYLWAASIAYGQVYVGVHYPLDVLVGSLIGIAVGYLVAKLYLSADKIRLPV